jgi:DNA-binding transcriptional ArsR family regulator
LVNRSRQPRRANARLDAVFSALSDPTRRAIVARLARGPASVKELAEPFDISLPAVSRHVRVLERAGLLRRKVQGRVHHCRLETAPLDAASGWIERHRRFREGQLDRLERFLERTVKEQQSDDHRQSAISPNCRKVLAVANRTGTALEKVNVDLLKGEQRKPEFLAVNPMGRVPVLVDGDFRLWESNAIMQYLAGRAKSDLWPDDPRARADIARWQFWRRSTGYPPSRRWSSRCCSSPCSAPATPTWRASRTGSTNTPRSPACSTGT